MAVAAHIWELGRWDSPFWINFYRRNPDGIHATEIFTGTLSVRQFIEDFIIDHYVCQTLSNLPVFSWVDNKFWDFIIGKKFLGNLWSIKEGTILPDKQVYARLEGKAGEVFLVRYGIQSIFDFQISLAGEAHQRLGNIKSSGKNINKNSKLIDAGSCRSFGYPWSLWVTRAAIASGFAPPEFLSKK